MTADALGSTRLVTDGTGAVKQRRDYMPFGEEIAASAAFGNRQLVTDAGTATYNSGNGPTQQFTGKERDAESGLDYFGARYYSGAQGRWTSVDRINVTNDRVLNPSNTLNKYVYSANNPLKYTDPDGEDITIFYRRPSGSGDFGHVVHRSVQSRYARGRVH